jgi:sec-independent protein translocase protein TatC
MPDEEFFEGTKMTFGEHLEELRLALFRSLAGLVIGVLLGLLAANYVVNVVKQPLQRSLEKYYLSKTIADLEAAYGKLPKDVHDFITDERLVFDNVLLERWQLDRLFPHSQGTDHHEAPSSEANPSTDQDVPLRGPSIDMARIRLWRPISAQVKSLNAHEVFMIWLKAGLITGAVLSSPWVFYQIWNFVAAGLYPHEKNYVHVFLPISLGLFLGGAALAFFFVFEPVLDFLFSFNKTLQIDPDPRISEWLGFVLLLPLAFGISFQLPLVMLLLNRVGIMPIETYIEKWRISVLVIFVVAMVLTPADPVSMLMMGIPLTVLYFVGILMCRWMPGGGKSPFGVGYDP